MRNIQIFLTPFTHESRALKQSKSLIDSCLFQEILFVVDYDDGLLQNEAIDSNRKIWRVRLLLPKKRTEKSLIYKFRYFEWIIRILFSPKIEPVDVVQCHSLTSLPVGVLIKLFKGARLIYDAHELETESNGLKGKRKFLYKIIEKNLIAFADAVIVVSESIADWYAQHYPINRPYVIRNIPEMQKNILASSSEILEASGNIKANLRHIFNLTSHEILFIYVGGLFRGRGIEILLETFSHSDKDKHIVFMGYGEFEDKIKEYQSQFSNIHFQPAVNPDLVINYTKTADVGISLIENICLSYYYCLPNKVFEYLLSDLPMIVSDFPEMGKLIDTYNCGWKSQVNESSLLKLVNSITHDSLSEKRPNVYKAKQDFGWHIEEEIFLEAYHKVLKS